MARKIPAEEWQARVDLAACYRLTELYDMSDLTGTHISVRVPNTTDEFLLNPYGMFFDEITASSLIRINLDGDVLDESEYPVNLAGYTIHSAVLEARPDVTCVLHTHTVPGMAVAATVEGLLPLSQHSLQFYERLSYHDYEGPATRADEKSRLQEDLGASNMAMVLRNHGLLACGRTVAEAFRTIFRLEKSCASQMHAMAMQAAGGKLIFVDKDVCERSAALFDSRGSNTGDASWPGFLRRLDKIDPSYKD